jgi:hypothetical protein
VQGRIHSDHPDQPEQVNMLLLDKLTAATGCQAITAALLAPARRRAEASTSSCRCSTPPSPSPGATSPPI